MGDLRRTWQAFKEKSLTEFKKANPVKDVANIPMYPLKFKLALGDALDSWEKATKPEDKKKYLEKAKVTMTTYKKDIDNAKLPNASRTPLNDGLTYLKGKLGIQ